MPADAVIANLEIFGSGHIKSSYIANSTRHLDIKRVMNYYDSRKSIIAS
jgi:hypothetical protein